MSLWRVQLLPSGPFRYKDRIDLDFTPGYLSSIAAAFDAGVFDLVAFFLEDAAGTFTSDPGRCRGEVRALEVVADGLDAVITADEPFTPAPDLRAAPLLIEDYHTADGQLFPVVLQQVLGTTRPMIIGLRPWRELEKAQ